MIAKSESGRREPLVVVGAPRSGTTLLWDLIRHDPGYPHAYIEPFHPAVPHEVLHAPWYSGNADLWPQISGNYRNNYGLYTPQSLIEAEMDVLGEYVSAHLHMGSVTKFIRLSRLLPWFCEEFPEVRILLILRDPRSVAFSLTGYETYVESRKATPLPYMDDLFLHPSELRDGHPTGPLRGNSIYTRILWSLREIYEAEIAIWKLPQVKVIRYESLVEAPDLVMHDAYNWAFGEEAPDEVTHRLRTKSRFTAHHWSQPVHPDYVERHVAIPQKVWHTILDNAGLLYVMELLNYEV